MRKNRRPVIPRCVLTQAMERANLRSPLLERAGFVVNETGALKKDYAADLTPERKKRSAMLPWLRRLRARMEQIDEEARAIINDFGVDAYCEARRREHEASSDAIAKDWGQIALAVARKMSKRIDVDPFPIARRLRRASHDFLRGLRRRTN